MANLLCAADMKGLDCLNLEAAIRALEAQGADELHFDVADGRFVPRFGFAPEVIAAAKKITKLPCHAHVLIDQPEFMLPQILACGADAVTLHVETCIHVHRALSLIRDAGVQAGIAINPATPLTKLNYLFPLTDRLLVLASDSAVPQAAMPRAAFERIKLLHENIRYHEYAASLEIEGRLIPEDAARCVRFGAWRLVIDPRSVSGLGDAAHPSALRDYRLEVAATVHTV